MDVALLCPLVVGVVRWSAEAAVIVKATFTLGGSRPGSLSPSQEPLHHDTPGELGTHEELERTNDFVPRKARADVLIVGHAHGGPQNALPVVFEVGAIRKHATAMAGAPSAAIPLSMRFLRSAEGAPVRTAPRPVIETWRSRMAAHQEATGHRDAPFDFSLFNVAPEDQQLAALPSGLRIALSGVGRAVAPELRLPPIEPGVFFVPTRAPRAVGVPVHLVCDTLWIHCERGICTLAWRGWLPPGQNDAFLVVDMGFGQAPTWAGVEARIGMASWAATHEEEEVIEVEPDSEHTPPVQTVAGFYDNSTMNVDAPEASTRPKMKRRARAETVPIDPAVSPDSTRRLEALPAEEANVDRTGPGETLSANKGVRAPALPFSPDASRALPPALAAALHEIDASSGSTIQFEGKRASAPALPFEGVPPDRGSEPRWPGFPEMTALPPAPPPPPSRPGTETMDVRDVRQLLGQGAPLPFRQQPAGKTGPPMPPAPVPAMPAQVPRGGTMPSDMLRKLSADILGSAPPPAQPAPPAPSAAPPAAPRFQPLGIDTYAKVKAALQDDGASLAAVLAAHQIDERTWRANERHMAIELARDAAEGRGELSNKLSQAMERANRGKAGAAPEDGELEEYAALRAEIEEATDPAQALRQLGLTADAWAAMRRDWSRRCLADRALAERLRQRLVAARHALRRQGEGP